MLGFADEFVMDAAALGTKNLEGEKSDECADGDAPGETCEAVIVAGVIAEPKACGSATDNGDVVDEACERGNQELLASVLDCNEDAADKDENLPGQNDAAVVSGAFQKLGRYAIDGQKRNQFLHPDERGNYENEENEPERVQYVAEELPAVFLVARDLVPRKNRDEDDGQKSGADYVIQDVRNHESEVESVFFERHAGGVGEEHFTENSKHSAQKHRNGDNNSGFIH